MGLSKSRKHEIYMELAAKESLTDKEEAALKFLGAELDIEASESGLEESERRKTRREIYEIAEKAQGLVDRGASLERIARNLKVDDSISGGPKE